MPEEQIPPVVAVVVAHDPGTWFEECLCSIDAQDYANIVVLVVDAASNELLASRVAELAPSAYLQRLETNLGFGPSVNSVLGAVEGAAYYLVCHDDVILAPDALRRMVEESYRSNAGIVGPKFVDVHEPDLILQFGLGVDRFGAPVRRVGHREFDQAQHDEAREVFAVPGGATLIRADLMAALGGYDPEISMFGEDVDLCWRARIAGASIVATPFAQVRHREATASRQRPLPNARALQWRHELRAVLKNYQHMHRFLRVGQLLTLSLLEALYFVAIGHRRRAREVVQAWRWNLLPEQHLKERRRQLEKLRRVSDHHVSELMESRTSRFARHLRPLAEQLAMRWSTNREVFSRWQQERHHRGAHVVPRYVTNTMWIAGLLLLFGARSVLVGRLPLIGQYLPLPTTTALIGHYFAGSTFGGIQAPGPVTPAWLFLGLSGIVLFGAMGLVLKIGLLACVILGAIGMVRVVRPFGPPSARAAAVVAYLYLPLAWDDLARGNINALIAYSVTPYIVARLMRATGEEPFVAHRLSIRSRATAQEILSLGILLTVTGAFEPTLLILAPLVAIGLVIGGATLSARAVQFRSLVVALGGSVLAVIALFPWSLAFFQPGVKLSVLTGAVTDAAHAPQIGQLFRFDLGPYGTGLFSWGLIAAATYVLFSGRSVRFAWGVRLWTVGLWAVLITWLAGQGWLGSEGGASAVLIAPFAVAIAGLVGIGVASVIEDLRSAKFGGRHIATILFGIACIAGILPILGATLNGRFDLPATGYDSMLSWIVPAKHAPTQRVLWLGNPSALPLSGWEISPGNAIALTTGGLPNATAIWPSTHEGNVSKIVGMLQSAESGSTVRLGNLLAPYDIRYVVVPTSLAPVLPGTQSSPIAPASHSLLDALANQNDLHQLPSEGGALVFANTQWPPKATVPAPSGLPSFVHLLEVLLEIAVWFLLIRLGLIERRRRRTARRHGTTHVPETLAEVLAESEDADVFEVIS